MKIKLLVLLTLLIIPSVAAHLAAGEDKEVGEVIVDLGWEPSTLNKERNIAFAVNLVDKETEASVTFEKVWIRIADEEQVLFAGNFIPDEEESVAFIYVFPEKGNYILTTRFSEGEEIIAETKFELEVIGSLDRWKLYSTALIIVLGIIIINFIRQKKKKKRK